MPQIDDSEKSIDAARLSECENVWGYRLPEQYRAFLLKHNGGRPVPDGFDFYDGQPGSDVLSFYSIGGHRDIDQHLKIRTRDRFPKRFHPIARDSGGNEIGISVSGSDLGAIYFWDHEEEAGEGEDPETIGNITLIANSLDDFLNGLFD